MNSHEVIHKDHVKRQRLIRKVLIGAGVTAGVVVAAIIIRQLGKIEVEVEALTEIAGDMVEATDGMIDSVQAVFP